MIMKVELKQWVCASGVGFHGSELILQRDDLLLLLIYFVCADWRAEVVSL